MFTFWAVVFEPFYDIKTACWLCNLLGKVAKISRLSSRLWKTYRSRRREGVALATGASEWGSLRSRTSRSNEGSTCVSWSSFPSGASCRAGASLLHRDRWCPTSLWLASLCPGSNGRRQINWGFNYGKCKNTCYRSMESWKIKCVREKNLVLKYKRTRTRPNKMFK